jgi:hypothetical protein
MLAIEPVALAKGDSICSPSNILQNKYRRMSSDVELTRCSELRDALIINHL